MMFHVKQISFLFVNFVFFAANFFSPGTKTLTIKKLKSFVALCLDGKYFLVPVRPGWELNYEDRL